MNSVKSSLPEDVIRVLPIGGFQQFGRNSVIVTCGQSAIILDYGVMLGEKRNAEYPDTTLVQRRLDGYDLCGALITHAHADHWAGLRVLKDLFEGKVPLYGSTFTMAIVQAWFKGKYEYNPVAPWIPFTLGPFQITPVPVQHSVCDTFWFYICKGEFSYLFACDFKVDYSPEDGEGSDFYKIRRLVSKPALMTLESTRPGEPYCLSEKTCAAITADIIEYESKRPTLITYTTFASHSIRVVNAINAATRTTGEKKGTQKTFTALSSLFSFEVPIIFPFDLAQCTVDRSCMKSIHSI